MSNETNIMLTTTPEWRRGIIEAAECPMCSATAGRACRTIQQGVFVSPSYIHKARARAVVAFIEKFSDGIPDHMKIKEAV